MQEEMDQKEVQEDMRFMLKRYQTYILHILLLVNNTTCFNKLDIVLDKCNIASVYFTFSLANTPHQ